MKARSAHRAEVSQVLTDDQRVIFNSRGYMGRGMRGPRGNMRGGNGLGMGLGPCGWNYKFSNISALRGDSLWVPFFFLIAKELSDVLSCFRQVLL
jgi:hypothetical protein